MGSMWLFSIRGSAGDTWTASVIHPTELLGYVGECGAVNFRALL